MEQELIKAQEANNRTLNSINLRDVLEEENLDENDLRERADGADAFYSIHFDKTLKVMVYKELERLGKEANTAEELLFSRGVIHGFGLVQQWFDEQILISREKLQDKQD